MGVLAQEKGELRQELLLLQVLLVDGVVAVVRESEHLVVGQRFCYQFFMQAETFRYLVLQFELGVVAVAAHQAVVAAWHVADE